MNCTYRSIWNDSTGTFVAVSENAKSAGKKTSSCNSAKGSAAGFALQALTLSVALAFGGNAFAGPAGGVVAAGAATINTSAGNTIINQSTQNAAINWQSFNIAAGEAVQFVQPNSSSVTLNRVVGADPSSILGSMTANGKVFLVNPNGVLFGKGSSVNVGGLVASTLNIADGDFMAGDYKFSGNSNGAVLNQGAINADGGYVALLGANVGNDGVIAAQLGTVALAAGNVITLDVAGDGLLNVTVNEGAMNALAQNGGLIRADGGQVLLTSRSASALLPSAVNNTGVIQAQTLVTGEDGSIMLMGDMQSGTVNVGGKLDASAPNGGDGGFVETSAAYVKVTDGARITTLSSAGKTGTWLIDPMDYTVAVAGGDITGTQLGNNLETTSVTIESIKGIAGTLGDVNVNDAVSWTAATTLTMEAVNDVNIKAAISGENGSVNAKAGNDVNVAAAIVTTTGHLAFTAVNDVAISAATTITTGNMTAVAGRDVTVSAASTITTGDMILHADNDGTGPGVAAGTVLITCGSNCLTVTTGNLNIRFNPVSYATTGAEITAYRSHLTGAGVLDAKAWVFGMGDNKMYDNTTAANVSGLRPDVDGVAPPVVLGAVSNANFDTEHVGANKPITYNSTFNDAVYALFAPVTYPTGTYLARGDITVRPLTVNAVTDTRVYNGTTSSVGIPTVVDLQTGDTLIGTLTQAYASKDILGTNASTLVATGPYTVDDGNGGNNYTVTVNTAPGTITPVDLNITAKDDTKPYDAAPYSGGNGVDYSAFVNGEGPGVLGGTLAYGGNSQGAVNVGSYAITPGGQTSTNYTIEYFNGTLLVTPVPLLITANPDSKTYDGAPYIGGNGVVYSDGFVGGEGPGVLSGALSYNGTSQGAVTPGSYAINPLGLTSSNYVITYAPNTLLIRPKALIGGITAADKPYDANNSATITGRPLAGVVGDDVVTYTGGTATFDNPTAGVGKPVTGTGLGLEGADAGNYTVNDTATTTATIFPPVVIPPVPPIETTPIETLPDVPYEGPIVRPGVDTPTWMPIVVPPATPPELFTLAPPPVPPVVVVPPPVLVVEQPPVIVAPESPPEIYVAPKRARKQDRN
ncbi:MAG: two-partner secretion domain-containing protein [Rhodoferax sp.]